MICFLSISLGVFGDILEVDPIFMIKVEGQILEDGKAFVTKITNYQECTGTISLYDGKKNEKIQVTGNGGSCQPNLHCTLIRFDPAKKQDECPSGPIWKAKIIAPKDSAPLQPLTESQPPRPSSVASQPISNSHPIVHEERPPLTEKEIMREFKKYIDSSLPFISTSEIRRETNEVENHIKLLRNWKDSKEYIRDNRLNNYVATHRDSISSFRSDSEKKINKYIQKFQNRGFEDEDACRDSIRSVIENRLSQREENILRLEVAIDSYSEATTGTEDVLNWKWIGGGAVGVLLLILLVLWLRKSTNTNKQIEQLSQSSVNAEAAAAIVVRRKTTTILKKQSLDDVVNNSAYLEIDSRDFCTDSAVRKIYLKNTCIKDIYNMYAEDLRNPNNPKEDGCMVLGRWILDNETNEYSISMEEVVLPGDDAVFAEYELNFGGKIKLKVTERLRKLRRDTDLQYDLTCWVHSHPGLGVFFSNSDVNVQTQLKHPSHPNFLTAFVIDILTPQQELGIFTFKHNSSVNSKADLKKMYSLEELYKLAVESERKTIMTEDFYDTLSDATSHTQECHSIELSNGAIIDMCKLVTEQPIGMMAKVYGFQNQNGLESSLFARNVSMEDAGGEELIGCFIKTTHCSIVSAKRAVVSYLKNIHFILVYSTADGLLTSIPIHDQKICMDNSFYGEQNLEDLKIWTRRKR